MQNCDYVAGNKIFTKPYNLLLIVTVLIFTGHYMLMGTMPLYARELTGSNVIAGMMVTSLTIAALLFRPIFGKLIDSKGRKTVLVIGAILLLGSAVLYQFSYIIIVLILSRIFTGVGFSAHTSAASTIVSDITPKSRLSEGISYYGIALIIGNAIGPGLGLFLVEHAGYQILFLSIFVLWALGLLFSFILGYESKSEKAIPQKGGFFEKTALIPSIMMFFVSLCFGAVIAFLPSYGIYREIDNIGVFFTVYAIAVLVSRLTTGKLADRHGFLIVLLPALLSLLISMVTLAYATSLLVVLISALFFGFGFGSAYPLANAIVIKLCSEKRRGAANSTLLASMDIGIGLGAFLWGLVLELSNYTTIYMGAALCALLSILVYVTLLHQKVRYIYK
jgi:MFS family permease